MSFYRERVVKKPKKQFACEYCGIPIVGELIYISGKGDNGDFWTLRAHSECQAEAVKMCGNCAEHSPCVEDIRECWRERKVARGEE